MSKMNNVINLYMNDGTVVENRYATFDDVHFDFAQVALAGKHANTADGNIMLVSRQDLQLVIKFTWYLNTSGYPGTYGTHDGQVKFSRPVPLHQILYPNIPQGYVVDHINRDRLDNRRENLRVCTAVQNSYNKSKPKNSNRRYKGVEQVGKKNPTFTASITKDGVKHEMKGIRTEEEAARMYDLMAEELFGEYAAKNFPTHHN
ncbi:HNH endonuclease [Yasminevirus sp. GU-2018]|uniref:HNH endonuclease n=1 Tax=Yasminevirus sp. GU-2018 TaxID=2420051 RepID=A0A5K0UAN8_9VIRU|nr:HNH endonuclease [Yasminevirus sp. GU-2018]